LVPLWRRGGPVLDMVPSNSGLYASIGPSVVAIVEEGGEVPTLHPLMQMNSTVSALDVGTSETLWVATRGGELIEFEPHEQRAVRQCVLGETTTSLSVAGDHVAVGLWSGKALVVDRACRIVGVADAGAPIRSIESLSPTEWVVGTETLTLGKTGGEVSRLRLDADESVRLLSSAEVPGAVVAISVNKGDGQIWVSTARGYVVRFAPGLHGSLDLTGEYRVSGEPADALVLEPYLCVLGRSREVWAFDLASGVSVDIQSKLAAADSVFARYGGHLYGGSRAGAVEMSLLAPPAVQTKAVLWEVGAATSVVPTGAGLAVLANYRALQRVGNQEVKSMMLPASAATLRPWAGGVAVVHGLGGIRIYEDDFSSPARHIRVPGLTRDIVPVDGSTAFVAAGEAGVHSVDVSGAEPQLLATLAVEGVAASVSAIERDVLLVGQLGADILVVDITQAHQPAIASSIDGTPDVVRFARTSHGVIALSLNGVAHHLRAEGDRPELTRSLRVGMGSRDLSLADNARGYVATDARGLVSVDIVQGTADPISHGLNAPSVSLCRQEATWILGLGPGGVVAWETPNTLYLPALDTGK